MFQGKANLILELYDYRDILKAMDYAKANVPKQPSYTEEEGAVVVANLFQVAFGYLQSNCEQI